MQSCVTENRIVHNAKQLSSNHSRWDVLLFLSKSLWSINESVFKWVLQNQSLISINCTFYKPTKYNSLAPKCKQFILLKTPKGTGRYCIANLIYLKDNSLLIVTLRKRIFMRLMGCYFRPVCVAHPVWLLCISVCADIAMLVFVFGERCRRWNDRYLYVKQKSTKTTNEPK